MSESGYGVHMRPTKISSSDWIRIWHTFWVTVPVFIILLPPPHVLGRIHIHIAMWILVLYGIISEISTGPYRYITLIFSFRT